MADRKNILAIISTFSQQRSPNVPKIIEALRNQTIPCKIVVADNTPGGHRWIDSIHAPDEYWRFPCQGGPSSRFAPALLSTDCPYTLFLDDDILPGPLACEHLLNTASDLNDEFATLGEVGRWYSFDVATGKYSVVKANATRGDKPMPVDMTCRAHFVLSWYLQAIITLRWDLANCFAKSRHHTMRHDDILLCQAIQKDWGLPSYLTPRTNDAREQLRFADLPAPDAASARDEHRVERDELVNMIAEMGWSSLV